MSQSTLDDLINSLIVRRSSELNEGTIVGTTRRSRSGRVQSDTTLVLGGSDSIELGNDLRSVDTTLEFEFGLSGEGGGVVSIDDGRTGGGGT